MSTNLYNTTDLERNIRTFFFFYSYFKVAYFTRNWTLFGTELLSHNAEDTPITRSSTSVGIISFWISLDVYFASIGIPLAMLTSFSSFSHQF